MVVVRLFWWRRQKDSSVTRDKALRTLRRIRKEQRRSGNSMSRNDGYSTPDRSASNGSGSF